MTGHRPADLTTMASCVKRNQSVIGPMLVGYTILVTYFLLQSAWNADVSYRLYRQTNFKFLDVLVQEERRHLQNVHDVVQNYRGEMRISVRDARDRSNIHDDSKTFENSSRVADQGLPLKKDGFQASDTRIPDSDGQMSTNDTDTVDLGDPEQKAQELPQQGTKAHKHTFQVEVEEWDANVVHTKMQDKSQSNSKQRLEAFNKGTLQTIPVIKTQDNSNIAQGSSKVTSLRSSNLNTQKKTVHMTPEGYTTDFCDSVYEDPRITPNICKRDLVETSHERYINTSSYSLAFQQIGDIYVYSAFLDARYRAPIVRVMALGGHGRDRTKSVYWCVFYTSGKSSSPKGKNTKSTNNGRYETRKMATQLTYYAASDGHKRPYQFYVMSCPMPRAARVSFTSPHSGLIEIVVGSIKESYIDTVQESITVKVIQNQAQDIVWQASGRKARQAQYFAKMEEDLLMLSLDQSNSDKYTDDEDEVRNISSNVSVKSVIPQTEGSKPQDQQSSTLANSEDKIVTCVAPLHGTISVVQMVEFIELTLLLGSQHIVFYTFRVFDDVRNVLNMYQKRGLVTVLPWNIPAPNSLWARGRDIALNDCLYRTMHLFEYGLFLDLDEFFVPRVTSDLPSFLKYLKAVHRFNSSRVSDLVFSSAYFSPPTKAQYKDVTLALEFTKDVNKFATLKSVYRSYFNQQHTLRMIRLSAAFRVGAGERKKTSFTISPRYAAVSHYSYCPRGLVPMQTTNQTSVGSKDSSLTNPGASAVDFCSRTKSEWTMWRYKTLLIERTKESIRMLNRK